MHVRQRRNSIVPIPQVGTENTAALCVAIMDVAQPGPLWRRSLMSLRNTRRVTYGHGPPSASVFTDYK